MRNRMAAALVAASLLGVQCAPAWADNQMGYQLLTPQQASMLPRTGGALGMDIGQGQAINDAGLSFETLLIKAVKRGSAGGQAGLKPGDQIIAVDGHVFPSLATFAAYVGSMPPGRLIAVDVIPNGGGPQQAQRVGVTVGQGGQAVTPTVAESAPSTGLSTGTKIAIGVGALLAYRCYQRGCLTRTPATP